MALGLESATPIPATSALCVAATILRDGDRAPAVLRLATTYALPLSRNPSRSGLGYTVGVDAGGRILLAGHSVAGPDRRLVLWRFYGDGSSDLTFGYAGVQSYAVPAGVTRGLAIDPSGRIIVTRSSGTLRIWP